eukprot:5817589-Pleurochrysis_carterae.AAC.3
MHGSPNLRGMACVLAERSRSPPQALGNPCSRWPPLPRRATSSSHPVGATQPPRLRLLPAPNGRIYICPLAPARLGW